MAMSIEELYKRYMSAYERGDYYLVRREWRMLSSEERLNIYYMAYKEGKINILDFEQFSIHTEDLKLIQEAKINYSKQLGLSVEQQMEVYWNFKFNGQAIDKDKEVILRNIAAYAIFREYSEFFEKEPVLRELSSLDYNILKCEPSRTKARVHFLRSLGEIQQLSIEDFLQELQLSREDFGYFYQEAMMDKLYEWQEKDPDTYSAVMKDMKNPVDMDYKSLEEGLSLFYNNSDYAQEIEKKKREINLQVPQKSEKTEKIEMLDVFGESVIAKDTGNESNGNHTGAHGPGNPNTNNREEINEQKVQEFIKKLMDAGFKYVGFMTTESGIKGKGEDEVFFHLFEKNSKRYLVPIGQAGNAMFLILNDEISLEELKSLIKARPRDKLVAERILERRHNKLTPDKKAYDYEATLQKLINWSILNEEGATDKTKVLTRTKKSRAISAVKEEVIEAVSRDEVPKAAEYIANLKVIEIEGHTFYVERTS